MVARRGVSPGKQLQAVFGKIGSFWPLRSNFRLTLEVKQKFTEKLRGNASEFYGREVAEVVRKDGPKLLFADGSWTHYRLSAREPVVRVYSEGRSREGLTRLSGAAKAWIFDSTIFGWQIGGQATFD